MEGGPPSSRQEPPPVLEVIIRVPDPIGRYGSDRDETDGVGPANDRHPINHGKVVGQSQRQEASANGLLLAGLGMENHPWLAFHPKWRQLHAPVGALSAREAKHSVILSPVASTCMIRQTRLVETAA